MALKRTLPAEPDAAVGPSDNEARRPVRFVDDGKLPAHLVGTHRRLRAVDVLEYRDRRADRLAAVDAIVDADAEVGIDYR